MKKYDTQYVVKSVDGTQYLINGFVNESNQETLDRASKFYGVKMVFVCYGDII